ncbi:MAG TPA: response regulator [Terriglobales bacterium]|nr:response regulator [Terriglobales bacterium]
MLRILIVDDEPAILGLLKSVLQLASFEIESARSAAEAKLRLSENKFDIVLTDMRMETRTAGFEVVRAARQLQPRPAIAILTAFPISPAEWRPCGADALIVKGTDIINLPDKLRALAQLRPKSEVASHPASIA